MPIHNLDERAFLDSMEAYIRGNLPEFREGPEFGLRFPIIPLNDFYLPDGWIETAFHSLAEYMTEFFPDYREFELDSSVLKRILAATRNLDGKTIWTISRTALIPPSLFTLFCIYLLRPFRHQATSTYSSFLSTFPQNRTYCPLCGASPALAISGKVPEVWCCHCGSRRAHPVNSCPSCTSATLEFQKIKDLEVMTCTTCRRYFKIIPEKQSEKLDLYYVATNSIDEEMHARGWVREYPLLPATHLTCR